MQPSPGPSLSQLSVSAVPAVSAVSHGFFSAQPAGLAGSVGAADPAASVGSWKVWSGLVLVGSNLDGFSLFESVWDVFG